MVGTIYPGSIRANTEKQMSKVIKKPVASDYKNTSDHIDALIEWGDALQSNLDAAMKMLRLNP